MTHPYLFQPTFEQWAQSVVALGFDITLKQADLNALGAAATQRAEYFFYDSHVPLPRPSTAIAWASLCSIGPSNLSQWDPRNDIFVVPFLPKLRHGEEVNQSLIRTSKAHDKDEHGRIRWGKIYIARAADGMVMESLDEGSRQAKEWFPTKIVPPIHDLSQYEVPPLYSTRGEGYQFGVIQNIPGFPVSLRDPFIMLARHGIIALNYGGINAPRIRRLLFRFLDVSAVGKWAEAYSKAIQLAIDEVRVYEDIQLLVQEIREKDERKFKAESKGKAGTDFDLSKLDKGLGKL